MTPSARRVLAARAAQELAAARAALDEAHARVARAEVSCARAREAFDITEAACEHARASLRASPGVTEDAATLREKDARLAAATVRRDVACEGLRREEAARTDARATVERGQRRVAAALDASRAVEAHAEEAAREARRERE